MTKEWEGKQMTFIKKLKMTYKYYKSLGMKKKPQNMEDLKIRHDAYAFLTCPRPVAEDSEEE